MVKVRVIGWIPSFQPLGSIQEQKFDSFPHVIVHSKYKDSFLHAIVVFWGWDSAPGKQAVLGSPVST
jgi:hypothetical protein